MPNSSYNVLQWHAMALRTPESVQQIDDFTVCKLSHKLLATKRTNGDSIYRAGFTTAVLIETFDSKATGKWSLPRFGALQFILQFVLYLFTFRTLLVCTLQRNRFMLQNESGKCRSLQIGQKSNVVEHRLHLLIKLSNQFNFSKISLWSIGSRAIEYRERCSRF